jgi:Zn-dependent M28 family amino/carboxypeptidase
MMFRSLAAAMLLTTGALAATPAVRPQPSDPTAPRRVQAHLQFLASDLLEGRDTGSRGHEIGAAYVVSQFQQMGLKPAGEKGSWYQWVPFRKAANKVDAFKATLDGKTVEAADLAIRPSVTEKVRDLSAGFVFAGYGIDDAQLNRHDYAGVDPRGKIVVVFRGTPKGLPSDIAAHLSSTKDVTAARLGAVGIVEIAAANPTPRELAMTNLAASARRSTIDWVDAKGNAGTSLAKGLRARFSISPAFADKLFAGTGRTLSQVRDEASRGKAMAQALKGTLTVHAESDWTDFKSPEVVAVLPGADPKLKGEYVAIMGHLDHLGMKPDAKPGEDAIYNGALDNGAGVATILEAAHEFTTSAKPPHRSILFMINTGEEKGLLGADYFAAHPTVPIGSIVAGVDLDMPIPLYPFTDVVAFGGDHSTLAEAIAAAGKTMGIGVSPDPMPEEAIFVRSDHYRFVERGIPAILMFTGYANGGKEVFEDFFSKRYHQVGDDLSQPIQWDSLARYAEFNYRIARQLADQDQRPLWYQGNYFGNLFAPGQQRAPAAKH